MKLKEFLLHQVPAGEIIIFLEDGYRVGATYIDNEDLFLSSLNNKFLDLYVRSDYRDIFHYVNLSIEECEYNGSFN